MAYRRNGLRLEELHSVKVDNLPSDCSNNELEEAFSKFGQVQDVYIPQDYYTRKAKDFGFVRFEKLEEAEDAAEATGIEIGGNEVKPYMAQRGKPRERKGGRGRGRRDDSRRGRAKSSRRRDSRRRGGRSSRRR